MRFDLITIFPKIFDSYLNTSIIKRAQSQGLIMIVKYDLRRWARGPHRQVDDKPYGGGAGMVLMAEPIIEAVSQIKKLTKKQRKKIIIFSAKGKPFNQKMATTWSKKFDQLILISGRYEGIDERVKKILKAEEVSVGPYVLTDGDLASLVVVSAITRLIPGVIKSESLKEESHGSFAEGENSTNLEYPQYTRPEIIKYQGRNYRVPSILLSGNHKKIKTWRLKQIGSKSNQRYLTESN